VRDLDAFLAETHLRLITELQALHNGDPNPQLQAWSTQDPVTLFGAKVPLTRGWNEISGTFRWLASRWSDCTDQRLDLVAAGVSGDLGYLVGFEHIAHSVAGVPVEPYTLRVTHIYRREQGQWKLVHRHADYPRPIRARPAKHRRSKTQGSAGPRWVRTASGTAGPRRAPAVTTGK
jgi:ketosteroid isomerase-like protein